MHQLSNTKKNRFAWLTPLNTRGNANGPWVLADNQTYRYTESDDVETRKISINSLLSLACSVVTIPSQSIATTKRDTWTSCCGRFRVEWTRQQSDTSRLFVQQAEDYYARIELFMDDTLLAAFHEPVWPHLQRMTPHTTDRLSVPVEYLNAMQSHTPARSSNQSGNTSGDSDRKSQAA